MFFGQYFISGSILFFCEFLEQFNITFITVLFCPHRIQFDIQDIEIKMTFLPV